MPMPCNVHTSIRQTSIFPIFRFLFFIVIFVHVMFSCKIAASKDKIQKLIKQKSKIIAFLEAKGMLIYCTDTLLLRVRNRFKSDWNWFQPVPVILMKYTYFCIYFAFLCLYSDVWKKFKPVTVDGVQADFVACGICWHVITLKKSCGTMGTLVHKCMNEEEATKVQPKISKFGSASTLPPQVRECLTTELVKFVMKDIRLYSAITGDGFQPLSQTLINYGARFSSIDVRKATSDRTYDHSLSCAWDCRDN